MKNPLFRAIFALLSLTLTNWALAATPAEKAAAETLFDEGVSALKAGDLKLACAKLESSQRIEPGVGVLLYLGDCYEKQGRTASAWAIFREAASVAQARADDRAPIAKERADRLTPRLSKLTITMEVGRDLEVPGLEITRDGEEIPRALWGSPIPVDPGDHVIVAVAPGYTREEVKVTIDGDAAVATLTVPHITKVAQEPTQSASPQSTEAPPSSAPSKTSSAQKPLGIAIAVTGLVGLAAGGTFGALAILTNNETLDPNGPYQCSPRSCPTQAGADHTNTARTFATISDVSFIVGGILTAAGVTLVLTAPKSQETVKLMPALAPGYAGAALGGTF
jgi:hypothetical protein